MTPKRRPDAIVRAQMPVSSRGNTATPIIIGLIMVIIMFVLLLLFMGIIPFEAVKGGEKESETLKEVVNQSEERAMSNLNITGSLYPDESKIPATPDPILSSLEQPFIAEQEQEERQIDD